MGRDRINITVVCHNRKNLTEICLTSMLNLTSGNFTVNVIDNGSTDGTYELLTKINKNDTRVKLHRMARNMGVAAAANYGWALDDAAYYVKLDNDIEIQKSDWLETLFDYLQSDNNIGAIGYKFLAKHKIVEIFLENNTLFWQFETCGGACIMIPPQIHQKLGFWNEDYGKYGFEDMDFSLRCRLLGFKTGYAPYEDKTIHLGYDNPIVEYEMNKKMQIANKLYGEKMFFFNKFLYENKIRSLYVNRRFLPITESNPIRLKSNPDYGGIIKMQNTIQNKIDFKRIENEVALDFTKIRFDNSYKK